MEIATVDALLAASGLIRLCAFHPGPADGVPGIAADPHEKATLIVIGNAGPAMWRAFSEQRQDDPHPLDNWSHRTLTGMASTLSEVVKCQVTALFPFDGPPYLPFQMWSGKSGNAHPSPIGPMVHKRYGLWHA